MNYYEQIYKKVERIVKESKDIVEATMRLFPRMNDFENFSIVEIRMHASNGNSATGKIKMINDAYLMSENGEEKVRIWLEQNLAKCAPKNENPEQITVKTYHEKQTD